MVLIADEEPILELKDYIRQHRSSFKRYDLGGKVPIIMGPHDEICKSYSIDSLDFVQDTEHLPVDQLYYRIREIFKDNDYGRMVEFLKGFGSDEISFSAVIGAGLGMSLERSVAMQLALTYNANVDEAYHFQGYVSRDDAATMFTLSIHNWDFFRQSSQWHLLDAAKPLSGEAPAILPVQSVASDGEIRFRDNAPLGERRYYANIPSWYDDN